MEVEVLPSGGHRDCARKKAVLSRVVALGGWFPMKRVAEALKVSCSRLAER
jgi:hypothetical protein